MPVINFSYSDLCDLVGREVSREELRERLPMIGADLKSLDDSSDDASFEFFPNRPDLYSVEGIARALRAFLEFEPGIRSYAVGDSEVDLVVDPSVNQVRPYIWSALVEGIEITDPLIRSMMDIQEKLHITVGRNRRKVAIGLHDFRTVKPPFTYKAVPPDGISFVPLQGSRRMTPAEILREHEKGKAYAFVLDGKSVYPMIVDSQGEVLSFPPIINGITTAITEETKDIFVDCTGTDMNAVINTVNIITTALAERGGRISSVKIHRDGEVVRAPDLKPIRMSLDPAYSNWWTGVPLDAGSVVRALKKMGYGAVGAEGRIEVLVPRYRGDIQHRVDLVEDVAIGYGFERYGSALPKHQTFAKEDDMTAFGNAVKPVMIGLGYSEVVTLSLSNQRDQFEAMNLKETGSAIHVLNPVSEEHGLVRVSLLPSLMTIFRRNKHRELPQRIFEIGDVVLGTLNRTMIAGAAIHAKAGFTEMKSVVQSLFEGIGLECSVEATPDSRFIDGRCASVLSGGERVGIMGEVSPATIDAFGLKYPLIAFELDLESIRLLSAQGKGP